MSLRDTIIKDIKSAMRAKDEIRLSTLRLIQAAIKDRDIAARAEDRCEGCEDAEIMALLQKRVKQRKDSAMVYEDAGRLDLAEREATEASVVRAYLPDPIEEKSIAEAAQSAVDEVDATGLKDMGKCMAILKKRYTGRMDFAKAFKKVKAILLTRA